MATSKGGAVGKESGRPKGSKDPSQAELMRRRLPKIYEAVRKKAETGDAEAARLCFDIVANPKAYPGADG